MSLPNDVARCMGQNFTGTACPKRDSCRRYDAAEEAQRRAARIWAPLSYMEPQVPGPCAYYYPGRQEELPLEPRPVVPGPGRGAESVNLITTSSDIRARR